MGERKVIQKYYPPDFDPALIPRLKKGKDAHQYKIRFMMPMSVRCNTCGEYIYRGKKFNARKETVEGEDYLDIRVHRFYVRCPRCSSEFTIKTDPKNTDYIAELGASRNFEPWKEEKATVEEAKQEREVEEQNDAMKALENRTKDSKREIDILEALDEIRASNARSNNVSAEELWKLHMQKFESEVLEDEDEELIKSINFKNSANYVRRLEDEDGPQTEDGGAADNRPKKPRLANPDASLSSSAASPASASSGAAAEAGGQAAPGAVTTKELPTNVLIALPVKKAQAALPKMQVTVKPRAAPSSASASPAPSPSPSPAATPKAAPAPSSITLLGAYGNDSD